MIQRKANGMSEKTMIKNLSELQVLFCHKYLVNGCNISKASEATGISRITGANYLKKEAVKQYLDILTSMGVEKEIATTDQLMEVLSRIAMGQERDEILNMKTGEIVKILPSAISRTQAINTILKARGELQPQISLTQNNYYGRLADAVDLTPLIESKEVMQIPIDVEVEVIE